MNPLKHELWTPEKRPVFYITRRRREQEIRTIYHFLPERTPNSVSFVTGLHFRNVNAAGEYANVTFSPLKLVTQTNNIVTKSSLLYGLSELLKL